MRRTDRESQGSVGHWPEVAPPSAGREDDARYDLLASAMAGRGVQVERMESPEEASFTDGRTIYLARGLDREAELSAVAVQAALLAAGSLDPAVMRRLVGRPTVIGRYLAVEGWRALRLVADVLPGISIATMALRAVPLSTSPSDSLVEALSRRPVPDLPDEFGMIRPRRLLAVPPAEELAAPTGSEPNGSQLEPDRLSDEDEGDRDVPAVPKHLFSGPMGGRRASRLARKLKSRRTSDSSVNGCEFLNRFCCHPGEPGVTQALALGPSDHWPTEVQSRGRHGWRYHEWDVRRQRYRPHWTTVTEVEPPAQDLRRYDALPAGELQRRLARLGLGLERHRRQSEGDDLDIDAVVESRAQFLAGSNPDDAVYLGSQRRMRSLSVLLLLDASGSSSEATPARSVHQIQQQAAAALLGALAGLGDRVAVYAFRSYGASAVDIVRVKSFEDTVNGAVYERLGALRPAGFTRMGAAIRHSAYVLGTRAGTDRRVLVVLSDGFPYDHDYERDYGEADTRQALAEARSQGIGCLCLTLGATTDPDALRRVFGAAAHASAPGLDDLLGHVGPLFRNAMASADLQRRLAQRHRRDVTEPA